MGPLAALTPKRKRTMRSKLCSQLMVLAVMAGVPAAFGAGLVDLGPAGPANWDPHIGNNKAPYIADVSKDGTLAGSTDSTGNPFIWTAPHGKVTLGTSRYLVGVDWLITNGVSTNVLAVVNDSSANYPLYWKGKADGTGGAWTSFPAADELTDTNGYWTATALGVGTNLHNDPSSPVPNWFVAGFRNFTNSPYEYQLRFQQVPGYATRMHVPLGSFGVQTGRCFFFAASDEGTFTGVANCEGSPPDGGAINGEQWYYGIGGQGAGAYSLWCGPPEAGNGTNANKYYTCIADAISGNGGTIGGVDNNGPWAGPRPAIFWDTNRYVYVFPWVQLSAGHYATYMVIRSINRDGKVMAGYFYADPPANTIIQAFAAYNVTYTARVSNSVTCTVWKVGDLLAARGMNTNGWTFRDVTALSDDGNTLVGYGVTNGVIHVWLAQLPPVYITGTSLSSGNVVINFTSGNLGDTTASFAVQHCGTVNGTYADVSPAAIITGSAGSFQATIAKSGNAQFYRIHHP